MITKDTTCAALIGCTMEEYLLEQLCISKFKTYHWKKIVPPYDLASLSKAEDEASMAESIHAIAEDSDISVVFISPKYIGNASSLIKAGKHVRVV